jgi:O-antigen ligase
MRPHTLLLIMVLLFLPHADLITRHLGLSPDSLLISVTNLILIIALLTYVHARLTTPKLANPAKAYSLFLILVLLGAFIATMTPFAVSGISTVVLLKRELSLMLLFYLPLAALRDESDLNYVFFGILIIDALVGFETLRSGVLGGSAFHDGKRGSGPFDVSWQGSDVAGGYLSQAVPLCLAAVISPRISKALRCAGLIALVLTFFGLLATYARGALLAAAVGSAFVLLCQRSRARMILPALILIAGAVYMLPQSTLTRIDLTTDAKGQLDSSAAGRLLYYRAALDLSKDYPFGVGTGNIRPAMEHYLHPYGKYVAVDPHNSFLYALAEYGIPGFLLFIIILGSLFTYMYRATRDGLVSSETCAFASGMLGFLVAFVVTNMFYANFYKDLIIGTVAIHFGLIAFVTAKRRMLSLDRK